ncbi:MAG: hypothetical protein ABIS14_09200 [Sphingomonas sp.]
MAYMKLVVALGVIVAASVSPASAHRNESGPAPSGNPGTLYCMHIEVTGRLIEPIACWTRDDWAEQGVDVDRDWAANGVRTVD